MWKGIWNHYRFSYKETTHFCLNYLNGKHFTWKNPFQIIWICVPDNLTFHSYESLEIHNLITDSIKMYIYFVLKLTDWFIQFPWLFKIPTSARCLPYYPNPFSTKTKNFPRVPMEIRRCQNGKSENSKNVSQTFSHNTEKTFRQILKLSQAQTAMSRRKVCSFHTKFLFGKSKVMG